MILGSMAGHVLRSSRTAGGKIRWLVVAGAAGLAVGAALGWLGWCLLLLAGFYGVIDMGRRGRWAFPLVVIGANSIAAYLIAHLFESFIAKSRVTHFGAKAFRCLGSAYEPLLHGGAVLLIMWLLLYWMYRRRLFLKI